MILGYEVGNIPIPEIAVLTMFFHSDDEKNFIHYRIHGILVLAHCDKINVSEHIYLLWRGMLPREGKGGQFPYPMVFESTGLKDWPLKQ